MEDFIVWDKNADMFFKTTSIIFGVDKGMGTVSKQGEKKRLIFPLDCTLHRWIGIRSVSKKKIYADSSVVEFTIEDKICQGYFSYNVCKLCYEIVLIGDTDMGIDGIISYNCLEQPNFNIVDTIQEIALNSKTKKKGKK